jgi:hypothetical protein
VIGTSFLFQQVKAFYDLCAVAQQADFLAK